MLWCKKRCTGRHKPYLRRSRFNYSVRRYIIRFQSGIAMTLYNDSLKMAAMRWPCNTQPNWEDITKILNRIRSSHFYEISVLQDEFGLLVAGEKLSEERANALYKGAWEDQDGHSWKPIDQTS